MEIGGSGQVQVPQPVAPASKTGTQPLPAEAPAAAPPAPPPAPATAPPRDGAALTQRESHGQIDTGDEFGDLREPQPQAAAPQPAAAAPQSPAERRAATSKDQGELLRLATDKDPAVRRAALNNPNTGPEVIAHLSPQDRLAVARDEHTSPQLLLSLADDKDVNIRQAVVRNKNAPDDALDKLANDKSPVVSGQAQQKVAERAPALAAAAAAAEAAAKVKVPTQQTPEAYVQQAKSQLADGKPEEAKRSYELAIELARQAPGAQSTTGKQQVARLLTDLANITFKQGMAAGEVVNQDRLWEARQLYKEAVSLDPQNTEALARVNSTKALRGQEIGAAREWSPGSTGVSGVAANMRINSTYNNLDSQFTKFMGDPPISNWMTFGKYASREAGTQIRNLETALAALNTLVNGNVVDLPEAAQKLLDMMHQDSMIDQGIRMAAQMAGINLAAGLTVSNLVAALSAAGPSLLTKTLDNVENLHRALVEGNTRIFENIAPAYDTFMQAEAAGRSGVDALKGAGYGNPPNPPDEQGFVLEAFTRYKQAQELGAKAAATSDPAEKQALLAKREQVTGEANLYIGLQEQMVILQKSTIFGDPNVAKMLGAMEGTMKLNTAGGSFSLLPTGGNWADFASRMGLQEVPAGTPGALPVRHPDGSTHNYVPNPDPKKREGTIVQLFTTFLAGVGSKILREGGPRSIDKD